MTIEKLKNLLKEATPTPWFSGTYTCECCGWLRINDREPYTVGEGKEIGFAPKDARLIAAAVNLFGPLLEFVEAMNWVDSDACDNTKHREKLNAAIEREMGEK